MAPDFQLFSSLRFDPLLFTLPANTESWNHASSEATVPSPFYMLPFHRDRLLQAAEHFGWTTAADTIRDPAGFQRFLQKATQAINLNSTTPLRVRTLLSHEGEITVEAFPAFGVLESNLFPKRLPPPRSSEPTMKVSPATGGALTLGLSDSVSGDPPRDEYWDVVPDTERTTTSPYTSYKTTSRDMYSTARERVGIKEMSDKKEVFIVSESGEIMEGSLTSVYFWRKGKWVTPCLASGGQAGTTRRWALDKK
jgi:hypothetical protein